MSKVIEQSLRFNTANLGQMQEPSIVIVRAFDAFVAQVREAGATELVVHFAASVPETEVEPETGN